MMAIAEARDGMAETVAVRDQHLPTPPGGRRRPDRALSRRGLFAVACRVIRDQGPLRPPTHGCRMYPPAIDAIDRGKPEWESPSTIAHFVLANRT